VSEPGRNRRQHRADARRRRRAAGRRDRAPGVAHAWRRAAEQAGCRPHNRGWSGPAAHRRPRRRHRGARRRPPLVAQSRSQRPAHRSTPLHRRRQATSETGCARQVHRALRLRPRLQRAGNAARPGRPPASHGRNAPVRGRVVHPGHSRRPHRADRKFSGCGREGRVGGGAYRPCARDDMERMAGTTNRPRTTSPWRWRSRWIGRAAGLPSGG
jgi:hypothetical protein